MPGVTPMDEIATPHDTYFRESFGRREVARDFLRVQLPADLLAEIDLDSLEIAKDSYVSTRPAHGLLGPGLPGPPSATGAVIYLLFEHKAAPELLDPAAIAALHRRRGRAIPQAAPQGAQAAAGLPDGHLPRQAREWKAPAAFHDLVEPLPAALAPLVPSFTYRLVDLSERTDAEIKGAVLTRLVQLALRWIFRRQRRSSGCASCWR
jgi:hypothetical protein